MKKSCLAFGVDPKGDSAKVLPKLQQIAQPGDSDWPSSPFHGADL